MLQNSENSWNVAKLWGIWRKPCNFYYYLNGHFWNQKCSQCHGTLQTWKKPWIYKIIKKNSVFFSSCPYFRNEVGGEMECSVALTRGNGNNGAILRKDENQTTSTHTPTSARGFCLFDSVDTYWNNGYCPYEPNNSYLSHNVIERIDSGSHYYKKHFYGQGKQEKE